MNTFKTLVQGLLENSTLDSSPVLRVCLEYTKDKNKNWYLPTEMSDPLYQALSRDLVEPSLRQIDTLTSENINQYLTILKEDRNKSEDVGEILLTHDLKGSNQKNSKLALITEIALTIYSFLSTLNNLMNKIKEQRRLQYQSPLFSSNTIMMNVISSEYDTALQCIRGEYMQAEYITKLCTKISSTLQYPVATHRIDQAITDEAINIINTNLTLSLRRIVKIKGTVRFMELVVRQLSIKIEDEDSYSDEDTDTQKLELLMLLTNTLYSNISYLTAGEKDPIALSNAFNKSLLNQFLEEGTKPGIRLQDCVDRYIDASYQQLTRLISEKNNVGDISESSSIIRPTR